MKIFGMINKKPENKAKITALTLASTIDIKLLSTNWANLTDANFIIGTKGYAYSIWNPGQQNSSMNGAPSISHSYNKITGILTINIPGTTVLLTYAGGQDGYINLNGTFGYLVE